ncbi:Protein CBG03290 [Caenorhabditis briggsae]|uniref:Protein CBG03290 n=1 Tax=Caenorhabditis briggsae TaxID=6238 RepID=A8WSD3_CAEBR|nr:Protein CBG03290 [Caenorhabditis briggsae]CAP23392.1 Protein CBG03290 [Caenorhabditis briggsae]
MIQKYIQCPEAKNEMKKMGKKFSGKMEIEIQSRILLTEIRVDAMSSTSSICSSNDADFIVDTRIPSTIRRDIDRFSVFINRLRATLDLNSSIVDGESMCVNVHASLEMVSESMRDLFKYSQFKTNPIILLSLQLVQAVKDLKFDTCSVDTTPVLNIIDQLESAVLNIIL